MPEMPNSETRRPDLGALWRHRALVVAALYGFVALVGALYYALLLGNFGLNPFHYWEASDFLLATLREPLSMVFGLIAVFFYLSMIQGRELNSVFRLRSATGGGARPRHGASGRVARDRRAVNATTSTADLMWSGTHNQRNTS